jgi:trehalose 6-phosphate phosphatase
LRPGQSQEHHFLELLKIQGVEVFDSTGALIHALRERGLKTAVLSSSKNYAEVLEAAGLSDLFGMRVGGIDLTRLTLAGKPAPDSFLAAAARLVVPPVRAVVVEDAIAGVQAGRNGRFGLVTGVARQGEHAALREGGAHLGVDDLRAIELDGS